MNIDVDAAWDEIHAALGSDVPVTAKMHRVIEVCERSFPHADWQKLRDVDYAVQELASWFESVAAGATWVGINNPVVDGNVTADMHVGGVYANSSTLRALYDIAYGTENGLGNTAEWPLALAFPVFAVRVLLGRTGSDAASLSVGFDNGDFIDVFR